LLLGAFNRGTEIRASEAEIPAEIVDPEEDHAGWSAGPETLADASEILKREIGLENAPPVPSGMRKALPQDHDPLVKSCASNGVPLRA